MYRQVITVKHVSTVKTIAGLPQVIEQKTTGDFFDKKGDYNYITGEMYASIFLTKGKICGEDNIVAGRTFNPSDKSGMEKHKEQLKMLFFNPGKKNSRHSFYWQ